MRVVAAGARVTVAVDSPTADLAALLATAMEFARTIPGSTPRDEASAGLADVFAKAYRILETRDRSVSPPISAATAARVVDSVLRPGEEFYPNEPQIGTMRLNFSHASEAEADRGLRTLADLIRRAA